MSLLVKVCGLRDEAAVDAAVEEGAAFVGFVFYPPSPRAVSPARFAELRRRVPAGIRTVGVFVDPEDDLVARVLDAAPLDLLQLHGRETPERARALRLRFATGIVAAVRVAEARDVDGAADWEEACDWLLFDARPPVRPGALPGGNAVAFDWRLLAGRRLPRPWLLAGGLDAGNLAQAVRLSGARAVDVSSGVESAPGRKDPERIRAFLRLARTIDPGDADTVREDSRA
ncbi:N-(5'-phosphoribosyl)anthranilate isomerase [bacterium HR40]|nr:N-(5'-phosphoribosyl)anthranilate isomerase [bacterium HR40]